jgi:hypothetical protein
VSASTTHVAGPDVTVDGRYLRQRCVWCSTVLLDYDLERVAVMTEPGREAEPLATWPAGSFVGVDDGCSYVVPAPDDGTLPRDSCMLMPPAETR